LEAGQEGRLEFVTPVPHSYPGNAVLTDDLGVIVAGDCPYGDLVRERLRKHKINY
jgi:hypothetical protein